MQIDTLEQIDERIARLSLRDQLWLVERLIRNIRRSMLNGQDALENQLSAMAADPEIQRESQTIEMEFAVAEANGLDNV
jgi:hypothetical protein